MLTFEENERLTRLARHPREYSGASGPLCLSSELPTANGRAVARAHAGRGPRRLSRHRCNVASSKLLPHRRAPLFFGRN